MKILLVGIDFFSYTDSLKKAFEHLGHEVVVCEMQHGWGIIGKIHREIINAFYHKIRHRDTVYCCPKCISFFRSQKVLDVFNSYNPDLLVAFPGYELSGSILRKMRNCKKAVWLYDSIDRLQNMIHLLKYYDFIFSFEGTDIEKYKKHGYEAHFLPLCVDKEIHYPIENEKDIDLSFVGNLSPDRVKILLKIREAFPDIKMVVYGKYSPNLEMNEELRDSLLKHQDIFMKQLISEQDANILYSKSKICLNIHHGQSRYGANMRFYEVMASKAFQIVDSNPYIDANFGDCVDIYHNDNELFEHIQYYLDHEEERNRIANNGYTKVLLSELYLHRAKRIIEME